MFCFQIAEFLFAFLKMSVTILLLRFPVFLFISCIFGFLHGSESRPQNRRLLFEQRILLRLILVALSSSVRVTLPINTISNFEHLPGPGDVSHCGGCTLLVFPRPVLRAISQKPWLSFPR